MLVPFEAGLRARVDPRRRCLILINNDFSRNLAASAGGFPACLQGADRRKPRFCWGKWESAPSTTSISASQALKNRCYLRKRARKPRYRRPGSLYTRRPGESSCRHPTVSIKSARALAHDLVRRNRRCEPSQMRSVSLGEAIQQVKGRWPAPLHGFAPLAMTMAFPSKGNMPWSRLRLVGTFARHREARSAMAIHCHRAARYDPGSPRPTKRFAFQRARDDDFTQELKALERRSDRVEPLLQEPVELLDLVDRQANAFVFRFRARQEASL